MIIRILTKYFSSLANGESIQIISALILQLFHCMVKTPELKRPDNKKNSLKETDTKESSERLELTDDHIIVQSYETTIRNGQSFITQFFRKLVTHFSPYL